MQIVINISDSLYDRLIGMNIDSDTCSFNESALVESIQNGTPLLAEHGNLVDINDVATALIYSGICDTAKCGEVKEVLSKIPIVVEGSEE